MFEKEAYWVSWLRWHLYRKRRGKQGDAFKGALLKMRTAVRRLPRGALVLDCGANVGDVSGYFLAKGMKVIAFEPDPTALAVLKARFPNEPRLVIEQKAVGAAAGFAPFYQTEALADGNIKETIASSLMRRDVHTTAPVAQVEIANLAEYIRGLPERVRILKLDIEGYEAEVLEALLAERLERQIDLILVETHEFFSEELAARNGALRLRIEREKITNVCLDWH